MLEGMAEYYSAELSEKVRRGQTENALKGVNNGGWVPFGYRKTEDQHLEIDPLTAPYVREIFNRYADGDTIRQILDDLNARGIRPYYGKQFYYSTLDVLLKNRKYIGEYKYRDIVIPGGVPAIIDEKTFALVQNRRERNRRTPAAAKAEERYLLTTKLFCGKCGTMMAGESGTSRNGTTYRYYKCLRAKRKKGCDLKAIKKDWIEDLVVNEIMLLISRTDLIQRITDRVLEIQGEESYDIKVLENQIVEIEKAIENMVNAIQAGIITASTKQRLLDLEQQKEDAEKQLVQVRLEHPMLSRDQISMFFGCFRNIDIHDESDRQRLIDCFVNAVYVYDDKLVFIFNYKDGTKTVPLSAIECSDLEKSSPPVPLP